MRKFIEGQLPVTNHRYLFFDALGSVDVIANETGAEVERMSFDVHGRRRNVDTWATPATYGTDATTRRGYTGHEQIDGAGLVHMRARMYDPQLGRFIQPDPMVDSDATQGWNRYSYVLNNPLSATDPTGMLTQRQAVRAVRTIAAIVVSIWFPQAGFWAGTAFQGFGAYMVSGFVAGGISGGWQGAIWGAFSAYTFQAVGAAFPGASEGSTFSEAVRTSKYWHKVLAHGTAGGVLNTLQGGKFGHGFVSNGAMEVASPEIQRLDSVYEQTFAAALIGGSVSELTGGKFANGAMTSAFAWAFNNVAHQSPTIALSKSNPKNGYADLEDAALAQFNENEAAYQATSSGEELFGYIATRKMNGKVRFFYSDMILVDATFSFSFNPVGPRNMSLVSFSHTHPPATGENQELFSGRDMKVVGWKGAPGRPYILRTPQGRVQYINPSSSKGFRATAGTSLCANGAICLPAHQKEPR